jgi:uncharacterized protein with HEPN domain
LTIPLGRDPKLYLKEIIGYIDELSEITKGLTYETFLKQKLVMHAVKDLLRDIAEAVWAISKTKQIRDLFYHYHIPYEKITNLRHDLTHEYFSADWFLIWSTAVNELPLLQPQFRKILFDLTV